MSNLGSERARNRPTGVWAAITTPFDEDERFDEGTFRENLRRLHTAGVHGVYTTDADGEFYALELDEFARVVDVFADETARLRFPCQVGVSWFNTAGVIARLEHCVRRGIEAAHVGHPAYMPMTIESRLRFWQDVADAVPDAFQLIHYNTPKMPNYMTAEDYAVLVERVPNLVGTKYVGNDVVEFASLVRHNPTLHHLVGEQAFGFLAPYGARGIYSWFANLNPAFMLEWYDDATTGRWPELVRKQRRLLELIEASRILTQGGNEHAAIAKALGAGSHFLIPSTTTRRPYLPIDPMTIERWRWMMREQFPDLIHRSCS